METILFEKTEEDIKKASKILKDGGLIAFPTETVYGLGADALNSEACKKVYLAKGRPSDNPMIVHISEFNDILNLTDNITEDMKAFMDKFWPGPLTMVVKAKDIIPKVTTGGLDTVAIRMPSNETARKLIKYSMFPIAAPSANLSGKPSPTKASHVIDDLNGKIDGIILGEDCKVGIESTVVDMTVNPPMILRPGIITKEDLSKCINKEVNFDEALLKKPEGDFKPKSPGMKYKHYAPNAKMILYRGAKEKVLNRINIEKEILEKEGKKVEIIVFEDSSFAAHELFKLLRECDKNNVDVILARYIDEEGIGFSVMNRMVRSAGYNIIDVK